MSVTWKSDYPNGRESSCDGLNSSSVPRVFVSQNTISSDKDDPLMKSDPSAIRSAARPGRWSTAARPTIGQVAYTMPIRGDGEGVLGGKKGMLRRTQTETDIPVAECSVCLEEYDYDRQMPRSLICGHTFCTRCLKSLLKQSPPSQPQIDCAKCHQITPVANGNINKLPKNFALMEVLRTISSSSPIMFSQPDSDGERSSSLPPPPSLTCPEHRQQLTNFCTKDGALLCTSCLVYGTHTGHKTISVLQASVEYREKLYKLSPEVLGQKKRMEDALIMVDASVKDIQETGQRLERETEARFQELIDLILKKRDKVKVEIMERTQIRVQTLMDQYRDLRECVEKADGAHLSAEELIQADDLSLLQDAVLVLDKIEGVFTNPPPTIPQAKDNLCCQFAGSPSSDLETLIAGYGNVMSDVGTVDNLRVESYHDGIRVSWEGYDFADNQAITYHLQMAAGSTGDYKVIYRGSATKFTLKEDLQYNMPYRFRVQVRTTEGVGNWCEPKQAMKPPPAFHWHNQWRNVKIELSKDKLEAFWSKGKTHHYWATFAGDKLFEKQGQYYCEIEIVDFGKHKPHKKLAIGVIGCSRHEAANLPWQDGQYAIGQLEVKSWSFHPVSGILNSHTLPPEGADYVRLELQNGDRIGMLLDLGAKKISFFYNGQDLGVAFDDLDAKSFLPAVSILDKIRVRLRFPPPPYYKRVVQTYQFVTGGGVTVSTSAPNLSILGVSVPEKHGSHFSPLSPRKFGATLS